MEKFIQRENVLVEFASSSKGISESSRTMSNKNPDEMDFNDVFGGPPRRFSNQEVRLRYSFGESEGTEGDSWMVFKEKPVFGEENAARRRHQGDGFYDDIFKADESRVSSPRKSDRDRDSLLWSGPSSRNMSPARSSSSKAADVLGTSLPAQLFSLPAKSSKGVEHPVFASQDYKTDDSTNIVNSPRSPSTSFSRFLAQAFKSKDDNRNEFHSITRPSPLSREPSLSSLDSSSKIASDKKGNIDEKLNKETKIADSDGGQFHFSIYTWAGIGVPMVMPLLSVNQSLSKDNGKYNKSANSYGKMGGDSLESKRSTVTNHGFSTNAVMETEKKDFRTKEEGKKVQISTEEKLHETAESKTRNKVKDRVDLVKARRATQSVKVKSVDEIEKRDKTDKEVPNIIEEVLKSKERILRESDKVKQPGKVSKVKENKTWSSKEAQPDAHVSKNVKKKEETRMDSDSGNVEKSSLRGGSKVSGVTPGKTGVKGKVKDFVQIFNQETDSNPKADVQTRNPSARWKGVNIDQTENEVSVNAEKVNLHNVEKKPDVPHKVDKNLQKDEPKQYSFTKNPSGRSEHSSSSPNNTFSSESLHRDRKISFDTEDPFANFVVEELFDDLEKVTQSGEGSEDMKALGAKIQQWSVGKKGNIRSLLSTLQFVLWPGSGWKPVALVDLIEANAVKRAYQKALLRIHPDKLQQKGAESTQKFIAEKVFDILQEAWDHFNSLAPL